MPGEKPAEASLDWKPNAHKCRDRESNPGLIGAKRGKMRCANLLLQALIRFRFYKSPELVLTCYCYHE